MYLSSQQLDIVIDMLDTKLSHMLVDGCDDVEELDTVKRCRLALRTARAASRRRDRQHRSRLAVLALPILLNACALPAWFSNASLAIDGISYVTSGKSVSDHALSAVANEDCAMWRALQARPICRDREVSATKVAAAPGPEEPEAPAVVLAVAPAAGGSMAPETATTEPHDEFEVKAAAFAATLVAEESEVPAAVLGVTPAAGGSTVPETATTETPATTAAPADRGTAAKPVQLATLAALLLEMEAKPKPGRFIVLGSYLNEANARDAMKRGHEFQPRMVRVRVHGRRFHRVVSGPYARSSIATMRRTLIGEGFRDAWTATLCQNTLRRAPCRTTLAPLNIATNPPAS